MDTPLRFDSIGTRWRIDWAGSYDRGTVQARINEVIDRFDRSFSRFRADSWVSQVRANPGEHALPPDAFALLTLYKSVYGLTDGGVTPLIGHALEQAGYDASYSLVPGAIEPVPAFDDVVSFTQSTLTTTAPVLLDFGAAGKGYLIDRVGEVLLECGIDEYVINAGGDILRHGAGQTAVTVGLENPFDTSEAIGTTDLANGSICGSAGSRRAWAGFTHIIDPRTLVSPSSIAGTWAKAASAAVADICATALYFAPAERVRSAFACDYAIVNADKTVAASPGFGLHAFIEGTA